MKWLILAMILVSCGPKEPYTSPEYKNVRKIDAVLYAECLMASQNEGIPLVRLKRECEDYAEIVPEDLREEKYKAINQCITIKQSEKWDETELKFYCTQNWRAHR